MWPHGHCGGQFQLLLKKRQVLDYQTFLKQRPVTSTQREPAAPDVGATLFYKYGGLRRVGAHGD